ncbi:transporter substrate-binding domain-containing protein [Colwellia sp. PAMC 21821]|uniref:substrate-binding periplasmic protein n=1 Tax=Colwellia sp. PAMC 21821 TaxID=1816219 RepID=UPI0009BCBA1A|nr:transporter substrate-binding domain-containing protein [Colwellia sp. PAMC 21821]ARD43864.1 hypothetical protein A3Q33_05785 [Colwellia sp. PAMC 21821]
MSFKITAQPLNTIIVATHIEPPFSNIVDGIFIGENIDIAHALAAKLNKKASFVYCPPARCFALLQSGQADMMIAIRKTETRKQFLQYLEPPIKIQKLPLQFYIHADSKIDLNSYEDLHSLNIGVLRGASYFDQFDQDTQLSKIPLTNYQQLVDMLLKGRIDTFLEREETITPWVDQKVYNTQIKIAKFAYDKTVGSYITVSKKSALANETTLLSQALKDLSDKGELQAIVKKVRN